jgi:hypothetical protein
MSYLLYFVVCAWRTAAGHALDGYRRRTISVNATLCITREAEGIRSQIHTHTICSVTVDLVMQGPGNGEQARNATYVARGGEEQQAKVN